MYQVYTLESILNFGKHKGKNIKDAIEKFPTYINYCLMEIPSFILSEEAEDYYLKLYKNANFNYQGGENDWIVIRKYRNIESGAPWAFVENKESIVHTDSSEDYADDLQDDIKHELRGMDDESGGAWRSNID